MNPQLDNHKRILGILYVVWASLTTLILLIASFFVAFGFQIAMGEVDIDEQRKLAMISDILQYVPIVFIIFYSLPNLIAGIGLLTRKSWAMLFALIVGCVNLLSFPFGTALGAYTIWAYSEEQRQNKKPIGF
jgi:hypothetical protein